MKKYVFREVYTPGGALKNGMITVDGKEFGKIGPREGECDESFAGYVAIPGIIDVHNHGFMGWSATSTDKNTLKSYAKSLASVGVTGVLATTFQEGTIAAVADVMDEASDGAEILGIHSEGPFITLEKKGAFNPDTILKADIGVSERLYKAGRGRIKYITIAPDIDGAEQLIRWWADKGVVVSAGHTNAYAALYNESVGWGLHSTTHLGNAMRGMHQRDAGVYGAALLHEETYVEQIADLFHVCRDMVDIVFRLKNIDKILLISDSGELARLKPGRYDCRGRIVTMDENGFLRLPDGTISGSSKYVLYGISNIVKHVGIPLEEVLKTSSINPATILGIQDRKGSITEGKDCDFVVIDDNFDVVATFVNGKQVYTRGMEDGLLNDQYKPMA